MNEKRRQEKILADTNNGQRLWLQCLTFSNRSAWTCHSPAHKAKAHSQTVKRCRRGCELLRKCSDMGSRAKRRKDNARSKKECTGVGRREPSRMAENVAALRDRLEENLRAGTTTVCHDGTRDTASLAKLCRGNSQCWRQGRTGHTVGSVCWHTCSRACTGERPAGPQPGQRQYHRRLSGSMCARWETEGRGAGPGSSLASLPTKTLHGGVQSVKKGVRYFFRGHEKTRTEKKHAVPASTTEDRKGYATPFWSGG